MTYLLFALGLAGLFFGGEYLVRGASAIARKFNLSPLLIGLTIVGFGTSAPELLVSIEAAIDEKPGIAIGNVLGSNISNILLILGVSALIAPLVIPGRKLWRELGFMLLSVAVAWVAMLDGQISRFEGMIMFAGLLVFLTVAFIAGSGHIHDDDDAPPAGPIWRHWAETVAGLVILVIGARLLVDSSTEIARAFGVSEAVIGLSIVAIGTSLPELATSIVAAVRRHTDIAVGNIIGSNIFNIFSILGITAMIIPIPAEARFSAIDMPWVAVSSVGLALIAFLMGGLPRLAGVALLGAYAGYILLLG